MVNLGSLRKKIYIYFSHSAMPRASTALVPIWNYTGVKGGFDDLKIMFPELVNKVMVYNDLEIQRGFKGLLVSLA